MLGTQQIQAMLETNYELLTKITSISAAQKQDPQTKAILDECNKALHENLMKLAGQADTNMAPAQPAAAPAGVPAAAAVPGTMGAAAPTGPVPAAAAPAAPGQLPAGAAGR